MGQKAIVVFGSGTILAVFQIYLEGQGITFLSILEIFEQADA